MKLPVTGVSDGVGAAQQHLKGNVGHELAQRLETLPWTLAKKTKTHVKRGAAPHFQSVSANKKPSFAPKNTKAKRRNVTVQPWSGRWLTRRFPCRWYACGWRTTTDARRARSCRQRAFAGADALPWQSRSVPPAKARSQESSFDQIKQTLSRISRQAGGGGCSCVGNTGGISGETGLVGSAPGIGCPLTATSPR